MSRSAYRVQAFLPENRTGRRAAEYLDTYVKPNRRGAWLAELVRAYFEAGYVPDLESYEIAGAPSGKVPARAENVFTDTVSGSRAGRDAKGKTRLSDTVSRSRVRSPAEEALYSDTVSGSKAGGTVKEGTQSLDTVSERLEWHAGEEALSTDRALESLSERTARGQDRFPDTVSGNAAGHIAEDGPLSADTVSRDGEDIPAPELSMGFLAALSGQVFLDDEEEEDDET